MWHSAAVPSSLYRYVRARGLRNTATTAYQRLRSEQRLIVLVKELDSIVEPRHPGDLRLEDLGAERLSELSQLNRKRGRPDIDARFTRYVKQGFRGFVGYRGEELVGYYWWVDSDVPTLFPDLRKLGLELQLGAGDVYGSDFFLLEKHRGGGVAADFLFKVESSLRDRGYLRLWGYVASDNRPARWVYGVRGYTPMWTIRRRKILIVQRATREST